MKKIVVIMLISILILSTTTTVFATSSTNLTELNNEYFNVLDFIDKYSDDYPYYVLVELNGAYMVGLSSEIMYAHLGNVTVNNLSTNLYLYCDKPYYWISAIYRNGHWEVAYYNSEPHSVNNYVVFSNPSAFGVNDIDYCNYNIADQNGTTVFLKARYLPTTIKGQISSKTIQMKILSGMKYLIPLVVGCLVLAIGFRKGWKMLKITFLGA